jgi:hypothetical protein
MITNAVYALICHCTASPLTLSPTTHSGLAVHLPGTSTDAKHRQSKCRDAVTSKPSLPTSTANIQHSHGASQRTWPLTSPVTTRNIFISDHLLVHPTLHSSTLTALAPVPLHHGLIPRPLPEQPRTMAQAHGIWNKA